MSGNTALKLFLALIGFVNAHMAMSQIEESHYVDKQIQWGGQIMAVNYSNRGYTIGGGYSRPWKDRTMLQANVGLLCLSYLERSEIPTTGLYISPAVLYFPDGSPNHKGIIFGVEMPLIYAKLKDHFWETYTTTGEVETFQFQKFKEINASTFQAGLAAMFGFRTNKTGDSFFWQPSLSFGFIYKNISEYTETFNLNPKLNLSANNLISQNDGVSFYLGIQIIHGLYKYKKTIIDEISF